MVRIYLSKGEFESSDMIPLYHSCCVGTIRVGDGDMRLFDLLSDRRFELVVHDCCFRNSVMVGYYLLSNVMGVGWGGGSIMVNYWDCRKLDDIEVRDILLGLILEL